jgi:hypothetical protein
MYKNSFTLTGIIYLHRITDNRMTGSAVKNLRVFRKLCGKNFYKNIVLATTMWETLAPPGAAGRKRGEANERELSARDGWWGHMLEEGSQMFQHMDTAESAYAIVRHIGENNNPMTVDIQREMIDEGRVLNDTTAGIAVNEELAAVIKKHEKEFRQLGEDMEQARADQDERMARALAREREKREKDIEKGNKAVADMAKKYEEMRKESESRHLREIEEHRKAVSALERKTEDARETAVNAMKATRAIMAEGSRAEKKWSQKLEDCEQQHREQARKTERDAKAMVAESSRAAQAQKILRDQQVHQQEQDARSIRRAMEQERHGASERSQYPRQRLDIAEASPSRSYSPYSSASPASASPYSPGSMSPVRSTSPSPPASPVAVRSASPSPYYSPPPSPRVSPLRGPISDIGECKHCLGLHQGKDCFGFEEGQFAR